MYSVLNTLTEYTYFYISKNITSYTLLLVFKIVVGLQCILNSISTKNPSVDKSENSKIEEISSLIYKSMPQPFLFLSNL